MTITQGIILALITIILMLAANIMVLRENRKDKLPAKIKKHRSTNTEPNKYQTLLDSIRNEIGKGNINIKKSMKKTPEGRKLLDELKLPKGKSNE